MHRLPIRITLVVVAILLEVANSAMVHAWGLGIPDTRMDYLLALVALAIGADTVRPAGQAWVDGLLGQLGHKLVNQRPTGSDVELSRLGTRLQLLERLATSNALATTPVEGETEDIQAPGG